MPFLHRTDQPHLFYRDRGQGRPVLFCSAWACSGALLEYQMIHLLERGFRVVSYDRRGHGRSDDTGSGYDYDTLADDLAALIEHLDLRDLTLVGHSMASGEIVRYLTRHGAGRIAGAALLAGTVPMPVRSADNPDGRDPAVQEAFRDAWRHDMPAWLEAGAPGFLGDALPGCGVSPGLRDATIRDMLTTTLSAALGCHRAITDTDFRAELPTIEVPVLIVQGDADSSWDIATTGRRQAELLPHNRFLIYRDAPHGLPLSHRERLNADLLAFVRAGLDGLDDPDSHTTSGTDHRASA